MNFNASRCQKMMRVAGVAYPRTCQECGLMGPCKVDVAAVAAHQGVNEPESALSPQHQQLCRFYGVKTLAELVDAQAKSIERLRAMKTPPEQSSTTRWKDM